MGQFLRDIVFTSISFFSSFIYQEANCDKFSAIKP